MILAIGRAERYSPNSVAKDAAILDGVCERMKIEGFDVVRICEQELADDVDACLLVSMGRSRRTLDILGRCESKGAVVVNSPDAVSLCCHRRELNARLEAAGVPLPPRKGDKGYWLKRGDGVAETAGDVRYAADERETAEVEAQMRRQGIGDIVVQAHVEGDLVKFYGVRHTDFFFTCYPGDDGESKFGDERLNGTPRHYAYDAAALHGAAETAAKATGVDVYGGDCIVRSDGTFAIIDFNDWPSFSRCREEAAEAIARMLLSKASSDFKDFSDSKDPSDLKDLKAPKAPSNPKED